MAPKLLELVFLCVCMCDITLGKGPLGLEGGKGKGKELLHVHFCSFFGCLVDV
jgi:hypothetical protein